MIYNIDTIKNTIINGDCLQKLSHIPDNSIHMIVTSPPYLVGKEYNEGADAFGKDIFNQWDRYIQWLTNIMAECSRVLIPSGKLCINIDDKHTGLKTSGKNVVLPTHAYLICNLHSILDYKEMILWRKIRGATASGGSSRMLGSYGRFGSPGEIPIVEECEFVLVFRKTGERLITDKMRKESALSPREFKTYGMQIWDIPPEKDRNHPAPFPVDLPYRLIRLFSFKDDIILDPFFGSGSTAVAAESCGRNYIGIELEKKFCDIAERRLSTYSNTLFDIPKEV